jgi:hypothetical protein
VGEAATDLRATASAADAADDVLLRQYELRFARYLASVDFNNDFQDNLLLIPSQKGKPKLCDRGFFYTVDKYGLNLVNWRCENTGTKSTGLTMIILTLC